MAHGTTIDRAKLCEARKLRVGHWLIYTNPTHNMHIAEIEREGDEILCRCNFGDGFPGITKIFRADDCVYYS